jgi:hypothetical protein
MGPIARLFRLRVRDGKIHQFEPIVPIQSGAARPSQKSIGPTIHYGATPTCLTLALLALPEELRKMGLGLLRVRFSADGNNAFESRVVEDKSEGISQTPVSRGAPTVYFRILAAETMRGVFVHGFATGLYSYSSAVGVGDTGALECFVRRRNNDRRVY